jgi:hypothetical protein
MKKFMLLAVLCIFASSLHASVLTTKWDVTNVHKYDKLHHVSVGGDYGWSSILKEGTYGTFEKAYDGSHGHYSAHLENGWYLDLEFNLQKEIPDGETPRCYGGGTGCDYSGWMYMDDVYGTITSKEMGVRYLIDTKQDWGENTWGQVGYEAGGVHVKPEGGHAFGLWFKWLKQEYVYYEPCAEATGEQLCVMPLNDEGYWRDTDYYGMGDINGNKVPIPAAWIFFTFGLVGLRALGIIRKKDA